MTFNDFWSRIEEAGNDGIRFNLPNDSTVTCSVVAQRGLHIRSSGARNEEFHVSPETAGQLFAELSGIVQPRLNLRRDNGWFCKVYDHVIGQGRR